MVEWGVEGQTISYRKGMAMDVIARIFGVALFTGGLSAGLGLALFGNSSDGNGIALILACVGSVIGAIAGTARETVAALRQKPAEGRGLKSRA